MFKGLKRAIQGGAGAIAEKGQDLASNVVNDQEFSTTAIKDKLKEHDATTQRIKEMEAKRDELASEVNEHALTVLLPPT